MSNTALDRDIRPRIDAFLEERSSLVKHTALDSVHAALGGDASPTRRGPSMKVRVVRPAKSAMTGGKRSSEDVAAMADTIAAYVRANEGQRLDQIATGLGTSTKELKLPVIKLLSDKSIKKTGVRRGTKYFVATSVGKATAPAPKAKVKAKRGKKK